MAGNTEKVNKLDDSIKIGLAAFCMSFLSTSELRLVDMFKKVEKEQRPIDAYFQLPGCIPDRVGGIDSPVLHLVAEAPCAKVGYPEIINNYYGTKNRSELWEKIVNAKNTAGETYLDYIETLIRKDTFTMDKTKACIKKLIAYACGTKVATYSKYKDKTCPPTGK